MAPRSRIAVINATINIAPLLKKLQTLGPILKKPLHELVREQAKLFVSSSGNVPGMIQVTPPFSQGTTQSKARKQGENKVRRDIRRVYGLPSDVYAQIKARDPKAAKAFWGMVRDRQWDKASELARRITGLTLQPFDGGGAHASRRSNGVVNGRRPHLFLRDPVGKSGELDHYITGKLRNVGILASGFTAAASQLGAKGVPPWVLRHGTRFSGIRIQETPTSFHITISDRVPFGQSGTIYRMRYVLNYRDAALRRSMPHAIRGALKTAGFAAVTS